MPRKKAERLTPIPARKPAEKSPGRKASPAANPAAPPDLSYIASDLHALAIPCAALAFHPRNPRKHGEKDLARLRASLEVNGQYKPIVASTRTDPPTVVAGNGTLAVTLGLGRSHIACVRKLLTEAQENQIAIVDNETGADPDWDKAAIAELLKDVDTACDPQLDAMLADLAADLKLYAAVEPAAEVPDETPPAVEPNATIRCPSCGHEFDGALLIEAA